MTKQHIYRSTVTWTGNRGDGTSSYRGYDRTWDIAIPGREVIHCSNDPLLGGNPALPNPEDLLLSALAACHMLWYLHLASDAGIAVLSYTDEPEGLGETSPNGAGRFLKATLHPRIGVIAGTDLAIADGLHTRIHDYCFIARSMNFPVEYEARYELV